MAAADASSSAATAAATEATEADDDTSSSTSAPSSPSSEAPKLGNLRFHSDHALKSEKALNSARKDYQVAVMATTWLQNEKHARAAVQKATSAHGLFQTILDKRKKRRTGTLAIADQADPTNAADPTDLAPVMDQPVVSPPTTTSSAPSASTATSSAPSASRPAV